MLQTCARGRSTPQPSCEETSMSDAARSRQPVVGIVMGSDSDWPVMEAASKALTELDVEHEVDVVSAHRMPREMLDYGGAAAGGGVRGIIPRAGGAAPPPRTLGSAAERGLRVIIAGAGGAAHLPGMLASVTPLPVIGVPVPLEHLDGMDSLLSIVQMPAGVPVATVSVGGARNAGLLAVRILGASDEQVRARMAAFQQELANTARKKGEALRRHRTGSGVGFGA